MLTLKYSHATQLIAVTAITANLTAIWQPGQRLTVPAAAWRDAFGAETSVEAELVGPGSPGGFRAGKTNAALRLIARIKCKSREGKNGNWGRF